MPEGGMIEVRLQPRIAEQLEGLPDFKKEDDKSRLRQLAGKFLEEFNHAKERKRSRGFERTWIENYRAVHGIYGPEWSFEEGQSQAFYKRPRERVDAAVSKILQITQPLHGRPYGVKPSPIPETVPGQDPVAACEGMNVQINDHWKNMDMDGQWEDHVQHLVTYGSLVLKRVVSYAEAQTRRGRLLKKVGKTKKRPNAKFYRCFDVYPDPDAKTEKEMAYVQVRHVLTAEQLMAMASVPGSGFEKDQVEGLIEAKPDGNWSPEEYETQMKDDRKVGRYVVYERWGRVPKKDQLIWGVEYTHGIMEAWHCEGWVLKLKKNEFWEDELPFSFIQYRKQDGSVWGMGLPEMMSDVTWMQNALVRAMDEDLGWSSGPMAWVDTNQVTEKDLKIKPRKVFTVRSNEYSKNTEPIRFQLVPSNMNSLMSTFQAFDAMIPMVTSLPALENPSEAGSGMRTIGQMQMYYAAAESFIKIVIGNIDRKFFSPMVNDLYDWEMAYGDNESIKGDFEPEVNGVKMAIQKEIIAQKAMDLVQILSNPAFTDVANNPNLLKMIVTGMGMEGEGAVLTPQELASKMDAEAQQKAMNSEAEAGAQERVRAETSRKDALLALAKNTPDTNPAWGAAMEIAYESFNAMTPQLYAGINLWAEKLATEIEAGPHDEGELNALKQPQVPEKPEDMDPDTRAQFQEVINLAQHAMRAQAHLDSMGQPLPEEIPESQFLKEQNPSLQQPAIPHAPELPSQDQPIV